MNPFVKSVINRGIVFCLIVVVVVSIGYGIHKWVVYEREVPDDFLEVREEGNGKHKKDDFPKDITFQYSMSPTFNLTGKDKLYVFGDIKETSSYGFYAVEKEEDTYRFLTGGQKDYPFQELSFYHLTTPFSFDGQAGSFTVRFESRLQYQQFVEYVDYGEQWRDIIDYYKSDSGT